MGKKQAKEIVIHTDGFAFGRDRLIIQGDPGYESWAEFGNTLRQVEGAVHWWIGDWLNFGEAKYGEQFAQALEDTGFAYSTIRDDKWVAFRIPPPRRRDILSFSHHKEVAGLDEAEQDRLLDEAIQHEYSTRQLRTRKNETRKKLPIPKMQFEVLYADPPWESIEIGTVGMKKFFDNAINKREPLSVAELCQLPIATMATPNAALFLWAPVPFVDEAMQIVRVWGFGYVSMFVWDREKFMYSDGYNRVRHEILLIAIRGNYRPVDYYFGSLQKITSDKCTHKKPKKFYEIIEKMYPDAKRIDLFATKKRKGWNAYNRGVFAQYKR